MAKSKRIVKSIYRLILPIITLLVLAVLASSVWLVYQASNPPHAEYMVTPEKYGQLSTRAAQVTEENWSNADGTQSRGWLLKGAAGSPAVILLHAYGADRSYVLNLAVKLNEATNFTVLMPDERGHGISPSVKSSSFGGCETDDALSAIEFLHGLKGADQADLVGRNVGFYGVEMGALAALSAAAKNADIKALALDSVPTDSGEVLASAVNRRFPFASSITSKIAAVTTPAYFYTGCYRRDSACDIAKSVTDRQILLLAGADNAILQNSTTDLTRCFAVSNKIETKTDLNPSGYNLMNASLEQSAAYDQRVIEFFKGALSVQ